MITRNIGALLRGKATPLQLMMACMLGGLIGFVPGFEQAPGLLIFLAVVLLVVNANIWLALIVALAAKALAWLLMPLTFTLGTVVVDGPTQGLVRSMINAPVLALFGFEYYLTDGGIIMGLFVGLVFGLVVIKAISAFRRKMAGLEEKSDRYKTWTSKKWVRVLTWVFAGGGRGKASYADLLEKKVGNPIRWWGAAVAGVVVILIVGLVMFDSGPVLSRALKSGLERANGATVDLDGVRLDLAQGRFAATGLAVADPKSLDIDLLRAIKIEAVISNADLLRKRVKLDRVVISAATQGEKRASRGKLIGPQPEPLSDDGKGNTLDDYLKDAQKYKERLTQIRDWLQNLSKPKADEAGKDTLKGRLAELIKRDGYAHVKADHLVEGSPSLLVGELIIEKLRVVGIAGETLDIRGENLSTQPHLVDQPPRITVKSSGGTFDLGIDLSGASRAKGQNTIKLTCLNVPAGNIAGGLTGDAKAISGGTIDLRTAGTWDAGRIDLPVTLTLRNTTIGSGKTGLSKVSSLEFPVGLHGPLDSPRIVVDESKLGQALIKAGAADLAKRLLPKGVELPKGVDKILPKGVDTLIPKGSDGKGLLDGLFPASRESH